MNFLLINGCGTHKNNVILSLEAALAEFTNILIVTKKVDKQVPYARKYWRQKIFDEFRLGQIWGNKS